MLLKSKKRIAALFTAVVMILTTAFSMPGIVRAEEETASDTDATQETSPADEPAAQDLDLQEDTEEVHDLEGGIWVYKRSPSTDKSSLYLDFSGSYRGSTPFIAYDAFGHQTESYCMQKDVAAPPEGRNNAVSYQSGVTYTTPEQTAGACVIAMYGFGGSNVDPNAALSGGVTNNQDGGTYGTYLVPDGAGGVKAVRGLMICGNVYEMTVNEARSLMQSAIHATTAGYSSIGTVYGKTNRNSVHDAYEKLVDLSAKAMNRCNIYGSQFGDARMVNVFNGTNRADSIFASNQSFTIKVYNASTGNWDAYTNTTELPEQYKQADGTTKFKVDYNSWGLCNKLVTSSSSGRMTVNHNYAAYTVGNGTGCYDYFTMSEAAGNTVPFTVSYDKVTPGTFDGFDDFWYQTTTQVQSFNQTAYLTCSYEDLQKGTLAFSANTGAAKRHTPYYGDGDNQQGSWYAARLYRNASYQDTLFCSPSATSSASLSATAAAKAYGTIQIHKYSTNTACTDNNACYSLEGAVFGVYKSRSDADSNTNAVTTIRTDAAGNGTSEKLLQATYYVKEIQAPKGYSLNGTVYTAAMKSNTPVRLDVPENPKMDPVAILLTKQNKSNKPIAGAHYTIKYYKGVKMDTDPSAAGVPLDRSWTFKTDENGKIRFTFDNKYFVSGDEFYYNLMNEAALPEGTVTIQETSAPAGYVLDPAVYVRQITPGLDASVSTFNAPAVTEETIRGDLEFTKINEAGEKLANVKFSLTNTDTGESHIIWTDENGYYSTSSDYIKHSKDTNTDKAGSGIWFGEEDLDDTIGALPYGTYSLKELRCEANKDKYKDIEAVTFSVTENKKTYNIGSIINEKFPTLKTTVRDSETGTNVASLSDTFNGIDVVNLEKLEVGHNYQLAMKAYSKALGTYLSEDTKKFEAIDSEMDVDVDVKFDVTEELRGTDVVIFEYLTDEAYPDELVAFEEDLGSAEQTIHFPKIGTTFTDDVTGDHIAVADKVVKHTDKVAYSNLLVGKTYKTVAELYFTDDGEPVKDADGKAITQEVEFTPEKPDGIVDATFKFDASLLAGRSIVAFETIYLNGKKVAAHADLTDEGQTIHYPNIGTTFTDDVTGDHIAVADKVVKHTDKVAYGNLLVGKSYKTVAELYFTDNGEAVKDADGKAITQEVEFTPEKPDGTVDVTFEFDASLLAGRSIVAFETIYLDGKKVAAHADLTDEGQTIHYPKVGTTFTDDATGKHTANAAKKVKHTDKVEYSNLLVGKSYKTVAELYFKDTGEAVKDVNGKAITKEVEFTPESPDGMVDVTFEFDASLLAGKSIVAFEKIYTDDRLVGSHADLTDEGQTITYPPTKPPVKTGDPVKPIIPIALGIIAAAGIVVMIILKKKHK